MLTFILGILLMEPGATVSAPGLYVQALWLLQQHGTPAATQSEHDSSLKSMLASALAKDNAITFNELGAYMSQEKFQSLAGQDNSLDGQDIAQAVSAAVPPSRLRLYPATRDYAEYLTTSFDMVESSRREPAQRLADWLAANYQEGKPLNVIVVCTGNSRRSSLGSSLGNLAAAYYGLSEIRFHSGGTEPTAFNPRTIHALQMIGFQIEATGQEAARGKSGDNNPIYRVSWGDGLETLEFSKHFADPKNPHQGFAAVMVCNEADSECPHVAGAAVRLSMPYADPKSYDGSHLEQLKYAERRDDIGRTMFMVMCQVRRAIEADRSQ